MSSPSPSRVAARAFALCSVVTRAYLEEAPSAHTDDLRRQVNGWLAEIDCEAALLPAEEKLLQRPVGRLSQREQSDASWLCEGLAILAFALGRSDLPLPGAQVEPRAITASLGFLQTEGASLLTLPTLRPQAEIGLARERQRLIRDRLHDFSRDRTGVDMSTRARELGLSDHVLSGVPLTDGDLRIDGKALLQAAEAIWREALDIAEERLRAAEWLCGGEMYGLTRRSD